MSGGWFDVEALQSSIMESVGEVRILLILLFVHNYYN